MNCFSKSSLDHHHSPCPLRLEDVQLVSCIPSPVSAVLDKNSSDEKVVAAEKNGLGCGKVEVVVKSILKKPAGHGAKGIDKGRVKWMDFVGKELVEIREFEALESREAVERLYINPTCDETFQQRYDINYNYQGGAAQTSPMIFSPGKRCSLKGSGFLSFLADNAPRFKALVVFIEHRHYGKSHPLGSRQEEYANAGNLAYFNSEQALADSAELITDLKKNLSAQGCPAIAIAGSYGGMLAAWFMVEIPTHYFRSFGIISSHSLF